MTAILIWITMSIHRRNHRTAKSVTTVVVTQPPPPPSLPLPTRVALPTKKAVAQIRMVPVKQASVAATKKPQPAPAVKQTVATTPSVSGPLSAGKQQRDRVSTAAAEMSTAAGQQPVKYVQRPNASFRLLDFCSCPPCGTYVSVFFVFVFCVCVCARAVNIKKVKLE